ncbi:winged helix-turn-helix transcriptional regulator [Actinoallomurus iriomotensis]|uniref:winged helix-turn-helix transcriptional regulator n=1 Tax=Actinoallomurus iriomotensis TaxID=478107 RepID=UPI0032DB4268
MGTSRYLWRHERLRSRRPFLADCPARLTVELIGGISRKMLTQTLRRLEAHGLIRRHARWAPCTAVSAHPTPSTSV